MSLPQAMPPAGVTNTWLKPVRVIPSSEYTASTQMGQVNFPLGTV